MRSILYGFFPDGLYCWVKCASACILLPGQYPCTCPATTSTPTGVSAGAARNTAHPEAESVATIAPVSLKTILRTSPATATRKLGRACTDPKVTSGRFVGLHAYNSAHGAKPHRPALRTAYSCRQRRYGGCLPGS